MLLQVEVRENANLMGCDGWVWSYQKETVELDDRWKCEVRKRSVKCDSGF